MKKRIEFLRKMSKFYYIAGMVMTVPCILAIIGMFIGLVMISDGITPILSIVSTTAFFSSFLFYIFLLKRSNKTEEIIQTFELEPVRSFSRLINEIQRALTRHEEDIPCQTKDECTRCVENLTSMETLIRETKYLAMQFQPICADDIADSICQIEESVIGMANVLYQQVAHDIIDSDCIMEVAAKFNRDIDRPLQKLTDLRGALSSANKASSLQSLSSEEIDTTGIEAWTELLNLKGNSTASAAF